MFRRNFDQFISISKCPRCPQNTTTHTRAAVEVGGCRRRCDSRFRGVEREDGDIRAPAARFAAAVCGGGRGSESAYTRLAQKRKTANVADDYATVKGYICANCMKLALPFDLQAASRR